MKIPIILFLAAAVAAGGSAAAESVRLRSGQTFDGDVTLSNDGVVVRVHDPASETETLRFKRSELAPELLFAILERRTDAKDLAAVKALAQTGDSLGLSEQALVQWRRVVTLDPRDRDARKRIAALEEIAAAALLADAKSLLAASKANDALFRLHAILETYPKTASAARARSLMSRAQRVAGPSAEVALSTVAVVEVPRFAAVLQAKIEKGDAEMTKVAAFAGAGGMADLYTVRRAIGDYEGAWKDAKRLPVTVTSVASVDEAIPALRQRAKHSLVNAWSTAGTILVQRRAISDAERFAAKALALSPQDPAAQELRRLILSAKTTYAPVQARTSY